MPVGGIVSGSSRAEAFFAVLNLKEKLAWDFTNPEEIWSGPWKSKIQTKRRMAGAFGSMHYYHLRLDDLERFASAISY